MQFKRGYLVWALLGNFIGLAILLAFMFLVPQTKMKTPAPGATQAAP